MDIGACLCESEGGMYCDIVCIMCESENITIVCDCVIYCTAGNFRGRKLSRIGGE